MTQLVHIPFRDEEILAVDINGRPHIVLRPFVESLGLDFEGQRQKLDRLEWATTCLTQVVGADGKLREMVTVDKRTFLMLLATISPSRVAAHVRPRLIAFQREVADVIEAYFDRGHVINPRASATEMYEPHTFSWDETSALIAQRFGIDMTVNDLCRTLRTAGVLKQTGAPTKAHRALFWFTGTCWNVHPHAVKQLAMRVYQTGRELQDFRFIQARMEFGDDGVTALGQR